MDQKLYGIADAALAVGCSQGTLRKLDEEGIVNPTRDPWGRRLFSDSDIDAATVYMNRSRARSSTLTLKGGRTLALAGT